MADLWKQIVSMFNSLSLARKITFVSVIGVTAAGLIFLIFISQRPQYQTLFSNLNPEDASSIVTKLKEMKVPYRIEDGGSRIAVASPLVYETRLTLAGEGIPQGGGVGFEIFDRTNFGATEFVQKVNYRRALQGELGRTIKQLAEVESTRVHIVIPERSLFTENQEKGKVSVVLKLKPGKNLSKKQIQGIVHLVSSSVEGITPSEVTVVDNYGRMLSDPYSENSVAHVSSTNLEYQKMVEKDMENRLQSMLERVVGHGKVTVGISTALDLKQVEKTEEKYDPDGAVVRSEQKIRDSETSSTMAAAGVPGVASNLPGGRADNLMSEGQPLSQKQHETTNYEISKVISKIVEPVGTIQKLTVAVLVDGTYGGPDKDGKKKYTPRSEEELQKITAIVKNAVGFNEDRGDRVDVVNIPFDLEEEVVSASLFEKYPWLPMAFKYSLPFVIVIMTFIFVLRPMTKWATQREGGVPEPVAVGAEQLPLSVTVGEVPEAPHYGELESGEVHESLQLRRKTVELAKSKPMESAFVIKGWLKEKT